MLSGEIVVAAAPCRCNWKNIRVATPRRKNFNLVVWESS